MISEGQVLVCTNVPERWEAWREAARGQGCAQVAPVNLDALRQQLTERPDAVVLLDVEDSGLGTREDLEALRAQFHEARILAFCTNCTLEKGRFLVEIGVEGYLPRDAEPDQVKRALAHVIAGGMWLPRDLMEALLRDYRAAEILHSSGAIAGKLAKLAKLTPRQHAVAKDIAEGLSNRAIAEKRNITVRTVKAHVSAIFERTGTRSRTELVAQLGGSWIPERKSGTR